MAADHRDRPGFSLRRWSQRKLEATRAATAPAAPAASPPALAPAGPQTATAETPPVAAAAPRAELPSPEGLDFDSDFTPFLQPKVDEALKRQALKKLFGDPRFNVMDGLDVYIDDYSRPDPLPPGMLEQLVQGRYLFNPPRTRVNAQGVVEEVPPDEVAADAPGDPAVGDGEKEAAGETAAHGDPATGLPLRSTGEAGVPSDSAGETGAVPIPAPHEGPPSR
jgi:hypothetical protein